MTGVAVKVTVVPLHIGLFVEEMIDTDETSPELGLIEIITVSLREHPLLVDLTIYCVVTEGVAKGFGILGLLRPVVGVHV